MPAGCAKRRFGGRLIGSVHHGLCFGLEVGPGVRGGNVVFVGDEVSPCLVVVLVEGDEVANYFLGCCAFRLHRVVGSPASILAFDDPVDAVGVKGDEVREIGIVKVVLDGCSHAGV